MNLRTSMYDLSIVRNDDLASIDELFHRSIHLRSSEKFIDFINFTSRLRHYSLFNNALVYMQNPQVTFYATEIHWRRAFDRHVKPDARPMVILAPMTPVLFVYDWSDTEGEGELPEMVEDLFDVEGILPGGLLEKTIKNCSRFKFVVKRRSMGTLQAGRVLSPRWTETGYRQTKDVKAFITINTKFDDETAYATLCHELAHVFLGHLGNDADEWWPNRSDLPITPEELEAEAVSYLVLSRLGLETKSAEYLAGYIRSPDDMKNISPGSIVKVASLIERMGKKAIAPKNHKKRVEDMKAG
jgi:hypothetical protein